MKKRPKRPSTATGRPRTARRIIQRPRLPATPSSHETLELCEEAKGLIEYCAGELAAVDQGLQELKLETASSRTGPGNGGGGATGPRTRRAARAEARGSATPDQPGVPAEPGGFLEAQQSPQGCLPSPVRPVPAGHDVVDETSDQFSASETL